MPILVIGLSHHASPVSVREQFAFGEKEIPDVLHKLRQTGVAAEAVVLSTCNRVEIYAASDLPEGDAAAALRRFFTENRNPAKPLDATCYLMSETPCLEHLFKVAAGLDSMVLGETEILGQLKNAYETARSLGHTGPRLNKAFQRAFNVAKQIRTDTNIQRGSVSVASVAVELAEKIFASLRDRQVMVLGAGETSEKTARALLSRGARSLLVSNRSHDRAVALAAELGGRAIVFEQWAAEFTHLDIIISSTAAPHYILNRSRLEPLLKARRNRSLLLIDIAVPRDIDPEVNFLENVYLYNIDDLQAIADRCLQQRKDEIARCETIIREKAAGLLGGRQSGLPVGSTLACQNG